MPFTARLTVYYAAKERGRAGEVVEALTAGRSIAEVVVEFGLADDLPPPRERMH